MPPINGPSAGEGLAGALELIHQHAALLAGNPNDPNFCQASFI